MKEKSSIISHSLNANTKHIGGLIGSSVALLASEIASNTKTPLILVNSSATHASIITSEVKYFYSKKNSVSHFRDRETLPYDNFSPHQSIISERLSVLHKLNYIKNGILIISESSLLQRLPPINYTIINTINLTLEKKINRNNFIENPFVLYLKSINFVLYLISPLFSLNLYNNFSHILIFPFDNL